MEKDKIYPIIKSTLLQIQQTYQQLEKVITEKKFDFSDYSIKRFLGKMEKLIQRIQTYEKLLKETLQKITKIEDNESIYNKILEKFSDKKEEIVEIITKNSQLIEKIMEEQRKIENIFENEKKKLAEDLKTNKNKSLLNKYKKPKMIDKGKFINKKIEN